MKLFNRIQVLEEGQTALRFSDAVGQAIGVKEGMTLHGLALGPHPATEEETDYSARPSLSVILSPFPVPAWPNLLRLSITVSPIPRALAWVVGGLNRLAIFCRHMESTDGLDMRRLTPKHAVIEQIAERAEFDSLIIPSTLLFVEIPPEAELRGSLKKYLEGVRTRDAELRDENAGGMRFDTVELEPLLALHRDLRALIQRPQGRPEDWSYDALRNKLGELLARVTHETLSMGGKTEPGREGDRDQICTSVDWISPMTTLNRLGDLENFSSDSGDDGRWRAWHARARSRKKFVVERQRDGFAIQATTWSNQIWEKRKTIPDVASFKEKSKAVAVCHADSDEQVICWDLFQQKKALMVALNLLIPASGLENDWWEWIFSTIGEADGNVLTAHASARRDGNWGVLELVVIFPFYDGDQEARARDLLRCFRILQGHEGRTDPSFHHHMERLMCLASVHPRETQAGITDASENVRKETTLQVHAIWDPEYLTILRDYWKIFRRNPYFFTSPLDQKTYRRVYALHPDRTYSGISYKDASYTRSMLADRIILRLAERENIAIIGAHRSGKTSVLNLISDRLKVLARRTQEALARVTEEQPECLSEPAEKLGLHKNIFPIVVRVHAATTPPYALLPAILDRLEKFADQKEDLSFIGELTTKSAKSVSSDLMNILRTGGNLAFGSDRVSFLEESSKTVARKVLRPDMEKQLEQMIESDGLKALGDLTSLLSASSEDQAIAFFGRSLDQIRSVVEEISQRMESEETFVVVLVDEVAKLSGWGDRGVLQTWRRAIEDRNYQSIRWVISASRPVAEFEALSPITNVFKEYNVGSLASDECEMLLDAFSAPPGGRNVQDVWDEDTAFAGTSPAEPARDLLPHSVQHSGVLAPTGPSVATEASTPSASQVGSRPGDSDNDNSAEEDLKEQPIMTYLARHTVRKLTSRLPFFLQVFLYHLYERSTRRYLPIVYRRLCCTVLEQDVIPEISDFLEAQWANVPAEIQDQLYTAIADLPATAYELTLTSLERSLADHLFSPSVGKVMIRSGLKGEDGLIIAPLVSLWLQGHQRAQAEPAAPPARERSNQRSARDRRHDW